MAKKRVVIFILFSIFIIYMLVRKNDKGEGDSEVIQNYLLSYPTLDESRKSIVDFSICDPVNSLEINFNGGVAKMLLLGIEGDLCNVRTVFEIQKDYYSNECKVPKNLGVVEFDGYNFDKISSYCSLN